MKTLFIASGPISWASARLRCYWPAEYMDGAKVVTWEEGTAVDTSWAETIVFQKVFDLAIAKVLRSQGKRVYWDLCDPLWWFSPNEVRTNLAHVDGVILSCEELKEDFDQWSGDVVRSWCIPDRIKLEHYPLKKEHKDANPVRLIWFGLAVNRWALLSALVNLERLVANGHKIELTIMDNQPGEWHITDAFPIYTVPWSLEQENEIIAAHDIAVLPLYPGPWGRVKSNNRALTAWACGVAMSTGIYYGELERLVMSAEYRQRKVAYSFHHNMELYDLTVSAGEWEAICSN